MLKYVWKKDPLCKDIGTQYASCPNGNSLDAVWLSEYYYCFTRNLNNKIIIYLLCMFESLDFHQWCRWKVHCTLCPYCMVSGCNTHIHWCPYGGSKHLTCIAICQLLLHLFLPSGHIWGSRSPVPLASIQRNPWCTRMERSYTQSIDSQYVYLWTT